MPSSLLLNPLPETQDSSLDVDRLQTTPIAHASDQKTTGQRAEINPRQQRRRPVAVHRLGGHSPLRTSSISDSSLRRSSFSAATSRTAWVMSRSPMIPSIGS